MGAPNAMFRGLTVSERQWEPQKVRGRGRTWCHFWFGIIHVAGRPGRGLTVAQDGRHGAPAEELGGGDGSATGGARRELRRQRPSDRWDRLGTVLPPSPTVNTGGRSGPGARVPSVQGAMPTG